MNKSPRFQHEAITELWNRAQSSLRKASRIFAIGYSLPPADTAFQHLLHWDGEIQESIRNSLMQGGEDVADAKHKVIYVVNTDAAAVDWYQRRLGSSYEIDGTYVGPDAIARFVDDLPSL